MYIQRPFGALFWLGSVDQPGNLGGECRTETFRHGIRMPCFRTASRWHFSRASFRSSLRRGPHDCTQHDDLWLRRFALRWNCRRPPLLECVSPVLCQLHGRGQCFASIADTACERTVLVYAGFGFASMPSSVHGLEQRFGCPQVAQEVENNLVHSAFPAHVEVGYCPKRGRAVQHFFPHMRARIYGCASH